MPKRNKLKNKVVNSNSDIVLILNLIIAVLIGLTFLAMFNKRFENESVDIWKSEYICYFSICLTSALSLSICLINKRFNVLNVVIFPLCFSFTAPYWSGVLYATNYEHSYLEIVSYQAKIERKDTVSGVGRSGFILDVTSEKYGKEHLLSKDSYIKYSNVGDYVQIKKYILPLGYVIPKKEITRIIKH